MGATERGVGLIKAIMRMTEEEGSCFKEALAVFRNIRNESGYSPNELFFLRNWRDHVLGEPVVEEMEKARDIVKVGHRVKKDENTRGWPQLHLGNIFRGRQPKTKE